jgi:hypothetical protein
MRGNVYAAEEKNNRNSSTAPLAIQVKLPIISMGVMNTMNPKLVEAAYNAV